MDLADKGTVVTGMGGALCSQIAVVLAQTGRSAIVNHNIEMIKRFAARIKTESDVAWFYQLNVPIK